mmetsp:Transcript_40325/g.38795  ORF Transcript_40325/g.38795 Transcript_40325/m.38795 type:complete len:81 (+) Transcript_40325:996-1238(+)
MKEFCCYKVDFYPEIEGQPVILQIWINQSNNIDDKKVVVDNETKKVIEIDQDITDNEAFFGRNLAKAARFHQSSNDDIKK